MTAFSNDFLQDLPPKDRRYDTPVAENLVFSVFPNGVKAWVHVYSYEGYVRRRTIGLFPEMDYAQAQAALNQSRRIVAVDLQQGARRKTPRRTNTKQFMLLVAGAVLGGVAVALSARWLIGSPSQPATSSANPVDSAPSQDQTLVRTQHDNRLSTDAIEPQNDPTVPDPGGVSTPDTAADSVPVQTATNEDLMGGTFGTTGTAGTEVSSSQEIETAIPGADVLTANSAMTPEAAATDIGETTAHSISDSTSESPVDDSIAAPTPPSQTDEQTREEQLALATTGTATRSDDPAIETGTAAATAPVPDNEPDNRLDIDPDTVTVGTADSAPDDGPQAGPETIPVTMSGPDPAIAAGLAGESAEVMTEAGETLVANLSPESGQEQDRPAVTATDMTDSSPATPAAASESGIRAQLTSGLADLEPTDTLSESLVLAPGETRRVYFFTEASGMTGERVIHRWQREGVIVTELPFVVADDPWKIYSSKNILAEQDGEWEVAIVAEDGSVLETKTFQIILQTP